MAAVGEFVPEIVPGERWHDRNPLYHKDEPGRGSVFSDSLHKVFRKLEVSSRRQPRDALDDSSHQAVQGYV